MFCDRPLGIGYHVSLTNNMNIIINFNNSTKSKDHDQL